MITFPFWSAALEQKYILYNGHIFIILAQLFTRIELCFTSMTLKCRYFLCIFVHCSLFPSLESYTHKGIYKVTLCDSKIVKLNCKLHITLQNIWFPTLMSIWKFDLIKVSLHIWKNRIKLHKYNTATTPLCMGDSKIAKMHICVTKI